MCQFDICACAPVQSGREGPRVSLIVDRRLRPSASIPGGRRVVDPVIDVDLDGHEQRGAADHPGDERGEPTFALAR
jgi:hypothetical protein